MISDLYSRIKDNMNSYLSEAIANIVSAAFKFMTKSELDVNEAK